MRRFFPASVLALAALISFASAAPALATGFNAPSDPYKTACYDLRTDIGPGSQDTIASMGVSNSSSLAGVAELQEYLSKFQGYSTQDDSGSSNGMRFVYGAETKAAVASLQAKWGISPAMPGTLDAATRAKIKALTCNALNYPASISDVTAHFIAEKPVQSGTRVIVNWTYKQFSPANFTGSLKDAAVSLVGPSGETALADYANMSLGNYDGKIPAVPAGNYSFKITGTAYDGDVYSASSPSFSVADAAGTGISGNATPSISPLSSKDDPVTKSFKAEYHAGDIIGYSFLPKAIPSYALYSVALSDGTTVTPISTFQHSSSGRILASAVVPQVAPGTYKLQVSVSFGGTPLVVSSPDFTVSPAVSSLGTSSGGSGRNAPAFTASCSAGIGPYLATKDIVSFTAAVTPKDPNAPVPAYTYKWSGRNLNGTAATVSSSKPYPAYPPSQVATVVVTDPSATGSAARVKATCSVPIQPADFVATGGSSASDFPAMPATVSCSPKDSAGNSLSGTVPENTLVVWTASVSIPDPGYSYRWAGPDHLPTGAMTSSISYSKPGPKKAYLTVKKGTKLIGSAFCSPSIRIVKPIPASAAVFDTMRSFWNSL